MVDDFCPDNRLEEVIGTAGDDEAGALLQIAALIAAHPGDPRLHFLGGSLLAAQARYAEARAAIGRAVAIAPDYALARFQLGLLEMSCGDAAAADSTLEPLAEAESDDALVLFARGLRHLARDELAAAADLLREGMARNRDHPLVSRDMELIVARIEESRTAAPEADREFSAAQMLLRQSAAKPTRH